MLDPTAALGQVACLRGRQVAIAELPGGLTNVNLRVPAVDPGPEVDVVVRIAQPGTELLAIDRYAEASNSRAAAAAGVGAPVVEHVAGAGLLVIDFLPGRTLTEPDLQESDTLLRVADACRRLHA